MIVDYGEEFFTKYGSGKADYEAQRFNPTFNKIVAEIKALGFRAGKLLDVGCAYGFFLAVCRAAGFELFGVDISEYAIEKARQNVEATLAVVDVSCQPLPFPDGSLDIVTMLDVLEHLENPHHALRECRRVLREGGLIYLRLPGFKRGLPEETHMSFFTPESIAVVVKKHGFDILKLGEEGGRWRRPCALLRLIFKGHKLFNYVPKGTGSYIACYALKR